MKIMSDLMKRAISEKSLRQDGIYTKPRSFGVYRVPQNSGRTFRFGNHPIRQLELIREFTKCDLEAVFLDRDDARSLAKALNSD